MSSGESFGSSKKKSDDIVSLDSWNEALSPLENVSNDGEHVNVFFENENVSLPNQSDSQRSISSYSRRSSGQDYGKNVPPARSADLRQKSDALVLNPSNLEGQGRRGSKIKSHMSHGYDRTAQVAMCGINQDRSSECDHAKHVTSNSQKHTYEHFKNDCSGNTKDLTTNESHTYHRPRTKHSTHHQHPSQAQNSPKSSPRSHKQKFHYHLSNQCNCQSNGQDNFRRELVLNRGLGLHGYPVGTSTYPPQTYNGKSTQPSNNIMFDQTDEDVDQSEKMKNKILSVWNNVRYGWTLKTKTNFKCDSPIFLLGNCYHVRPSDDRALPGERTQRLPSIERFKQDFSSQLWFTYRQDFPQIPGTKLTTDCGWGCMLRSGQMLLARAFVNHFLGRDWSVFREQTMIEDTYRKQIIRWFGDFPSDQTPFSVHRLAEIGKSVGKGPGEWYGPSSVAFIFRECMQKAYDVQPVLSDICIYVAQDCTMSPDSQKVSVIDQPNLGHTVYKKDIYEMCSGRGRAVTKFSESSDSEAEKSDGVKPTTPRASDGDEANEWKRAVIVLVPVRLGGEDLNSVYTPCIKSLLTQDSCIGIIGGKPKHSLYFVGFQDDKLIYLDPHYCQDAVDTRERNFPVQSYHCLSPRKMSVMKMDPSCTIGFYCKTRAEFEKFVSQSEAMVSPPKQKLSYPMFVFSEGKGTDISFDSLSLEEDRLLRIRHVKMDQYGRLRSGTIESEEFVVL